MSDVVQSVVYLSAETRSLTIAEMRIAVDHVFDLAHLAVYHVFGLVHLWLVHVFRLSLSRPARRTRQHATRQHLHRCSAPSAPAARVPPSYSSSDESNDTCLIASLLSVAGT